MNFEDERYVRVYTRDTSTWQFLRWEGQAVFVLLLRKVDRVGVFDLSGADPVDAVTAMLGLPESVVRVGLERLLKYGVIEKGSDCLVVAKFIEAQEASMSPNARQKESRLRRRDQIRAGLDPSARATVVYFIQSEHGGPIKIGRSDDLAKRLVGLQTSRPDKLVVLASAPGTLAQEHALHARFADAREKGEWFSPVPELLALIKKVAKHGALDTERDESQTVTSHETSAVTPYRTVPSQAVPNQQEIPPCSPPQGDAAAAPPPEPPRARKKREGLWRRVPATWQVTDEHRQMARDLALDVEREAEKFRDHEFSKPRSDPNATFRNWLRTSAERGGARPGPRRDDPPPGFIEHSQRPESRWLGGAPKRRAGQPTLAFGGTKP